MSTHVHNPTPMELGQPEHFKGGNEGYNLDFEPYASKYDNKLVVDPNGGDVIGKVLRRPNSGKFMQASV